MCGIAGIWNRNGQAVAGRAIDAMNPVQRHRGPDGEGRHLQGDVVLGHRRLSIVDLSAQAAQPFWLPDRSTALVYNGEIHNYVELAAGVATGRLLAFGTVREAAMYLSSELRRHDLLLLKGSNKADHLARIALNMSTELGCWRQRCGRKEFCDRCGLLRQRSGP